MSGKVLKRLGAGLGILLLGTSAAAAMSGADARAVVTLANPSVIKMAQSATPLVAPYTWSATKAADGSVAFTGFVPSKDVHDSLVDGIGQISSDSTTVATGSPPDFASDALAALQVLSDLDSGKVAFDGISWSVSGVVASADQATAAQKAFDELPLKALNATYKIDGPKAAAALATPSIITLPAAGGQSASQAAPAVSSAATTPVPSAQTPPAATPAAPAVSAAVAPAATAPDYSWSGRKSADGSIDFTGSVANATLKAFLANHTKGKVTDSSKVAAGAPQGFVGAALYGLDALMALDSGKLSLADGKWRLAGTVKDEAAGKAAVAALGKTIDTKAWSFDVKAGPAQPVAAAVAAPAAPAPTTAAAATSAATATTAAAPAAVAPAATAPAPAAPAPPPLQPHRLRRPTATSLP